jgi:hypothetical protein
VNQSLNSLTNLSYGYTAFLMRYAQTLLKSADYVVAAAVEASTGCWEDAGQRWRQLANGDGEKNALTRPDALVSVWHHTVQDATRRVQEATCKIGLIGAQTHLQLSQALTDHLPLMAGTTVDREGTMTSDAGAAARPRTAPAKAA